MVNYMSLPEKVKDLMQIAIRKAIYREFYTIREERSIEYPFVFMNIGRPPATLLDVGCSGSNLPVVLATLGFNVYGIDIRDYHIRKPLFKFVNGDIRSAPFPDHFFDIAIAVSTIEHIGLANRYGSDEEDPLGDKRAMNEIKRILKENGKLILTVPYGRPSILRPWCKVYGSEGLRELLRGFAIIREEYFVRDQHGYWKLTQETEASEITPYFKPVAGMLIDHLYALACLVVMKH